MGTACGTVHPEWQQPPHAAATPADPGVRLFQAFQDLHCMWCLQAPCAAWVLNQLEQMPHAAMSQSRCYVQQSD